VFSRRGRMVHKAVCQVAGVGVARLRGWRVSSVKCGSGEVEGNG
jgi:hypothetical protein